MRLYDRYIVTLAMLFAFTTVVLAMYRPHQLEFYLTLYLIEYLGTTLFFTHLHPQARRLLNTLGYTLFAGFLVFLGVKVVSIIWKVGLLA